MRDGRPDARFVTTSVPGVAWKVMAIFLFTGRSVLVSQASFTASGLVESTVGSSFETWVPSKVMTVLPGLYVQFGHRQHQPKPEI